MSESKNILITGSEGFIAQNLILKISELNNHSINFFKRGDSNEMLAKLVKKADVIFHLAGENRPKNSDDFNINNTKLTETIAALLNNSENEKTLIFSSSIQATLDNDYGISKKKAEDALIDASKKDNIFIKIFRLPGIFGKWSKPNYNSVISTFCFNIANNLPIEINNPDKILEINYIDDVIDAFISSIYNTSESLSFEDILPRYSISVQDLADQIKLFNNCRSSLLIEDVGCGLTRKLYATYVSYLPTSSFKYSIENHQDDRGSFVEMLKTKSSGQFSFFTAKPGITRGEHYHHTKTEKFLVIVGKAKFKFRHVITNEYFEILTSGESPEVVETIPGWTHDITNIGEGDMVVMLWANEIFDPKKPDTIYKKV